MYKSFVLEQSLLLILGRVGCGVGCPLSATITSVPARSKTSVSVVEAATVPTYSSYIYRSAVWLGIHNEWSLHH